MALTRITSTVIKDATISEGKFDKPYLDSSNADIATQAITFQSNVNIRVGTGSNYFTANNNLVTVTAPTVNDTALNISLGNLNISQGNINIGNGSLLAQRVKVNEGSESAPSIYFGDNTTTGLFYNNGSIAFSVSGSTKLQVTSGDGLLVSSNKIQLSTIGTSFDRVAEYVSGTVGELRYGGLTDYLSLTVNDERVINIRAVNASGSEYQNSENRVGINKTDPQTALDVAGTVTATGFSGIQLANLPVIDYTRGGTGRTDIGTRGQLLRVNETGDGFEYFTLNTGDVNNLASFLVSGDDTLYSVSSRLTGTGGRLKLDLGTGKAASFLAGQTVKVFGINTENISSYDKDVVTTNIYKTWAQSIDNDSSFTAAQGGTGGGVRYYYYAALINFNTGVVSSLKALKHSATGNPNYVLNFDLGSFNENRYNSVSLRRPDSSHGILLYRYQNTSAVVKDRDGAIISGHTDKLNLIAILGQRDIGSATTTLFTYNDYGPYNRVTWGDANSDGSLNSKYLEVKTIPTSIPLGNINDFGPYPGWAERTVYEVETGRYVTITNATAQNLNFDSTDLSSSYLDNTLIQICHDDTAALEEAIDSVVERGFNSLFLTGGTYLVKRLAIPNNFSLYGSGKATIIKKQYFDTIYNRTSSPEFNRMYAAVWMRNPVKINLDGSTTPSNSESQPVSNITLRDFVVDGNYNNNMRIGDSTRPESNCLVYAEGSNNCALINVDITHSVGDGLFAQGSNRLSLQNTSIFDNSITYGTFDNPLNAVDCTVLKVSDCSFLSNPGPADITTSEVVAFNSCIIRNSGTGLRIYGARSINVENNLILGPDDEWIPTTDLYDSDYNSVNLTCYKSTGAGTQGPIKFTYLEDGLAKNLQNTTLSTYVYTVSVDLNGNETLANNALTYLPTGSTQTISVLQTSIYDVENGGVQIEIPSSPTVPAPTGTALAAIPFRKNAGSVGLNYNYLVYFVNGLEQVSVGDPDNYIIDGVIGYDSNNQLYTIKIADEYVDEFKVEDVVTLLEHNPSTGYSTPNDLIVSAIRFQDQAFVLDLFLSTFNQYNLNNGQGSAGSIAGIIDTNARGYIKKKRSFTIAKGIIGVI
jgi:hypothetical protein